MRGPSSRTLLPILCLLCLPAFSQPPQSSKPVEVTIFAPNPCAGLPTNIAHAEAVTGICQFAMSLPQKMPNFICDQDASRYRGKNRVPFDLVAASVRYEDGREYYDDIKVNGRPAPDAVNRSPGLWSTGEFGSNLRSIFDSNNQAIFEFVGERNWKDHAAWVFSFTIAKQNVPLWRLNDGKETLAPAYKGELWVDQKSGDLLRFGSVAAGIPKSFAIAEAEAQIDYSNVRFADGTSFVLPADFTVVSVLRGLQPTRNLVQFRNCHKFRAKSRMVLNLPKGSLSGDSETDPVLNASEFAREAEENEKIYAILREQAVRDDSAQLEIESRMDQDAATIAAFRNWNALEKQRGRYLAEREAAVPPSVPQEGLTTLRVSVKLVPVSVVLRDSKGNALGSLRKEQFQLFDNGKPQAITSFSVEKSGSVADLESPAQKYPASPAAAFIPQGRPEGRDVAYIFDDIHSDVGDLAQAGDAAARHIAALGPDDRAAVFSTSGEIGTAFTTDRQKLLQALQGLRQHPALHGAMCPPMSEYMADLIVNQNDTEALDAAAQDALKCAFAGMATSADMLRGEQLARITAFEVVNAASAANQNTLGVLYEVVRRTAAMPGSRSIVLVSPGFLTLTPEVRQSMMELVDHAVRANIVVHTLDVRGLYTPGLQPNIGHPANPVLRAGLDRDEALAQSDVMAELAYGTGGTFFHNNNDVNEGFRRTADAPEYLYVLGFSPQKLDGKFHKLTVKVAGPGKLTVQARQGYYAKAAAAN
jgi:VWFA-related protein